MDTKKTDVLDKIALILNMAKDNPYPEEAETCMLKAQALLAKHGLEMSDVSLHDQQLKDIGWLSATGYQKVPWWYWTLAHIIADNFRCYMAAGRAGSKAKVLFFGDKFDVNISVSVFKFAADSIARHSLAYARNHKSYKVMSQSFRNALRNDYIDRYLLGVKEKLSEQIRSNQEWALVLVKDKDVVEAHAQLGLKSGRSKTATSLDNQAARAAGYDQGKQFQAVQGSLA